VVAAQGNWHQEQAQNRREKGIRERRIVKAFGVALALCLLIGPRCGLGQRLVPEVQVNVDRLPQEAQTKLQGLQQKLQEYIERKTWVNDDYRYDLNVLISIFFTEYAAGPPEDKYKARLIVTNQSDARFEDRRWDFSLRADYQFREDEYDPLTSVIEFYIWMIYGMEFDKLEKLGGRRYYDKARDIVLQSNRSFFVYGWDKRDELLRQQVSTDNTIAREMSFFWDTGMYYYDGNDYSKAKDYLYYALDKLQKVPAEVQSRFLEANYLKLGEALVQVGYADGIRTLKRIDPGRASEYDRILSEGEKP
jgi:hypothetical protein